MIFFVISIFMSCLFVLFSVMFITLLERKILSYSQNRLGPNKVLLMGLIQPVLDGVKLLFKQFFYLSFSNKMLFYFACSFLFFLLFNLWFLISLFNLFSFHYLMFFILCLMGFSVYGVLLSGWVSNSKYSMLGSVRSMAQTISYEISMALLLFSMFIFFNGFNLHYFFKFNFCFLLLLLLVLIFMWMMSLVAESNRAPFDFAEGESELVSGFNTEYFSSGFAFLFIAEYGMIIFYSLLTSILWGMNFFLIVFFIFSIVIIQILFIRSVFPRFRYDKLMEMAWFKFLPIISIFVFISASEMFFF